jgi:hypothetical protein
MSRTILLDPVLFDALHLAALANGGVGNSAAADNRGRPVCGVGLSEWVEGRTLKRNACYAENNELHKTDFSAADADNLLRATGIGKDERTPFDRWCDLVNVDVAPKPTRRGP